MTDTKTLAAEKLAASGLNASDAKLLHITSADSALKLHKNFPAAPVLIFNYYDPRTKKPFEFRPGWGAYYRIRLLATPADFSSQTKGKAPKYLQEADSGIAAYFPSNIEWAPILDDADIPLMITEGELKAAKACKEGFATIGLGGVYSFQSSRYGFSWLPELEAVNWVKRRVFICYDSDTRTNEDVCEALNKLAQVLMTKGALPYVLPLPDILEEGKTGLDDFLLEKTAADLTQLMNETAMSLTLAAPLFKFNSELVYVRNPGIVLVRPTGQKLAPGAFAEHAYSTHSFSEQVLRPDGSVSMKQVSAASAWLRWPLRVEANRLTYEPGAGQLLRPGTTASAWNTWPGWGCEPEEGDVQPFIDLVDHLFKGSQPEAKEWFLKWCAYPIQYPGTKLFTSCLLWGVRHGTGKSLIGYTLGAIYGKNFTELNQKDLYDGFNEWAENKQFVMGDDVTGSDKRHDSDRLKKFITQKELRLNIKHVQSFTVPDCINYFFTANGPTALFLEDDDRRSFVHEVLVGPLEESFYVDYSMWLATTGPAALFHYLKGIDTSDFNPAAPALRTDAKERMIADVRSDLGQWVAGLLQDPDHVLRVGKAEIPKDLFTNKELLALYDPEGKTGTTANGLGRELRRVGLNYVLGGKVVKTKEGSDRYYVVRNRDVWLDAGLAAVQQHLMQMPERKPKKF